VSRRFPDPGRVGGVRTIRLKAERVLNAMTPTQRAAWEAAMDEAAKDILNEGTVLSTTEIRGTYSKKWDEWHMPPEAGTGISTVDDGVATVSVVEYALAGTVTVCEVSSYLSLRRLFHEVVVGEITITSPLAPATEPAPAPAPAPALTPLPSIPAPGDYLLHRYSPANFARQMAGVEQAYLALIAKFKHSEATEPGSRYSELGILLALLESRLRMFDQGPGRFTPLTDEERARIPRWFLMSPTEFEHAIAALCLRDGCTDVETRRGRRPRRRRDRPHAGRPQAGHPVQALQPGQPGRKPGGPEVRRDGVPPPQGRHSPIRHVLHIDQAREGLREERRHPRHRVPAARTMGHRRTPVPVAEPDNTPLSGLLRKSFGG